MIIEEKRTNKRDQTLRSVNDSLFVGNIYKNKSLLFYDNFLPVISIEIEYFHTMKKNVIL
jgi:hypothetical protein